MLGTIHTVSQAFWLQGVRHFGECDGFLTFCDVNNSPNPDNVELWREQ